MSARQALATCLVAVMPLLGVTAAPSLAATTTRVDNNPFELGEIACPSAVQCTALDTTAGSGSGTIVNRELTFNPSAPGNPAPRALPADPAGYTQIACPSSTQCTVLDGGLVSGSGQEVTFNPQAPSDQSSAAVAAGAGPTESFACASTTQCTASFKAGSEVTFDPQAPSSPSTARLAREVFYGIACPAITQCSVVSANGNEVTFDPQSPAASAPVAIDSRVLSGIACPSITQCTTVDQVGDAVTFNPVAPGAPTVVSVTPYALPGGGRISCPALSQCTAIFTLPLTQAEFTFDPNSQAKATSVSLSDGEPACPSTSLCIAVGGSPFITAFNPRSPAGAIGNGWTSARCTSTLATWKRQHRHATARQRTAEAKRLAGAHGCPLPRS